MTEPPDDKAAAEPDSNTIMVVIPDVLARMVIADYLRSCGYKVIEGIHAADVFAVLRDGGFVDVVFAEANLAGEMDGFALASQIRQTYPNTDVILTSGEGKAADKAADLCDDGPMDRPYHPQEVVRRIKVLRERRRVSKTP